MNDKSFQKMIDTIGIEGCEKLLKLHQKIANVLRLEGAMEFYENSLTRQRLVELSRLNEKDGSGENND